LLRESCSLRKLSRAAGKKGGSEKLMLSSRRVERTCLALGTSGERMREGSREGGPKNFEGSPGSCSLSSMGRVRGGGGRKSKEKLGEKKKDSGRDLLHPPIPFNMKKKLKVYEEGINKRRDSKRKRSLERRRNG